MIAQNHLFLSLAVVLMASTSAAQTTTQPPRFNGDRTTASSSNAAISTDEQRQNRAQGPISANALVGAAMLEAAREEGRYFIEELRSQTADD